tara:strand:- start:11115 stop:11426 length:312 start_codon:yes stop_codon:yes gene_type:complete
MIKTLGVEILSLVLLTSLFISRKSNQDKTKFTEKVTVAQEGKILDPEEQEIKTIVEKFLMVAGNYNLQAMDSIISDKAKLGIAIVRDGVWKNSVSMIGDTLNM